MGGEWRVSRIALTLAALAFGGSGCTTLDTGSSGSQSDSVGNGPAPVVEIHPARWDNLPDGEQWSSFANAALNNFGANLIAAVPSDIAEYCPKYPSAGISERKAFWIGLLSALAKFESNYDPQVSFTENKRDAQGNLVVSRGLLQISIESGRGYGCVIPNDQSLHDPQVNLTCAVRILNKVVPRDNVINSNAPPWKGAAAYWSPFRKMTRREDIRSWSKQQAYCQL